VGPEAYHRDPTLQQGVLEHFRLSLTRIADRARGGGARVIFVQPAANLKDFTPFKSEHREGLAPEQVQHWTRRLTEARREQAAGRPQRALELLREIEALDPEHAYGLWCVGDAWLAAGRNADALTYFVRAKDNDICPLRASSSIREVIFEVAREKQITVVDFPQILANKYGALPAVGLECFLDHVHPTLASHADLGRALATQLADLGVGRAFAASARLEERVRQRVCGPLTPYDHVMAMNTLAMTLSWAGKNEEALRLAQSAVEALPQNSDVLAQYGRLLEKVGRDQEALQAYQQALAANPEDSFALARLGDYYGRRNDYSTAREYLVRAVRLTPQRAPVAFRVQIRIQLGDCLQALGNPDQAKRLYQEAALLDPRFPDLKERLK
jgi:tetratricopeptide (TPR) repeat protein